MQIRQLLTLLFIFLSLSVFANIDSTGVKNNDGKKLIIHKVKAKETYFSIARKYGVTPKVIMDFNNSKPLQPGMLISVPTERPFTTASSAKKNTASKTEDIIKYKVKPKESLYSISQKFNTTVADLRELNGIKGDNLSIGQTIKVKEGGSEKASAPAPKTEEPPAKPQTAPKPAETVAPAAQEEVKEAAVPDKDEPNPKTGMNKYGLREHNERGVAIWIEDENVDGTKLLVLHRTAPIGTVMKITNPMTDKSALAKVVGKFTENESTKDVIVVLTKAVAELIGAVDKRFQVSIDYGLNE